MFWKNGNLNEKDKFYRKYRTDWIPNSKTYDRTLKDGTVKTIYNTVYYCKMCGYKSVVKTPYCPKCGRKVVNTEE